MERIPLEIVFQIANYLDIQDVASLQNITYKTRQALHKQVWQNTHLIISDEDGTFDQDSLEPPKTQRQIKLRCDDQAVGGLLDMLSSSWCQVSLKELRYLTISCCSSKAVDGDLARFLQEANPQQHFPNLKRVDVFSTIKQHQPTHLMQFLTRFDNGNVEANLYLDAQTTLDPHKVPGNVQNLVLSTISGSSGTEKFDLHDVVQSKLLNNVKTLHLLTDASHPITKQQLMGALEQAELKSLKVTPHCVECDDDNVHWDLPRNITDFQLHVPSFDQEWSPSHGSITSDSLQSLRVPSNGENRLYNMRFPNLRQLHLEGTVKDAFKLPPGIQSFCETSVNLQQLQLSGFSMSDTSQIVNQFQPSVKSVVLQNTVTHGREYNVYQWNYLPNLEFLVVDFSPLSHNQVRATKRLLQAVPKSIKMYIIDHRDSHDDSLWCRRLESTVLHDGISEVDLLEGVNPAEWSAYELDIGEFTRQTREIEL